MTSGRHESRYSSSASRRVCARPLRSSRATGSSEMPRTSSSSVAIGILPGGLYHELDHFHRLQRGRLATREKATRKGAQGNESWERYVAAIDDEDTDLVFGL